MQDLVAISTIFFNFVTASAALLAAFRYLFIAGSLRRHTELSIAVSSIATFGEQRLVQIEIEIVNKGREMFRFFNCFVSAESVTVSDDGAIATVPLLPCTNAVESEEEWVRLPADTGITIARAYAVAVGVNVVAVTVVVPYAQRRLPCYDGRPHELAAGGEFNSLHKVFPIMVQNR